jgi:hypothetical protein
MDRGSRAQRNTIGSALQRRVERPWPSSRGAGAAMEAIELVHRELHDRLALNSSLMGWDLPTALEFSSRRWATRPRVFGITPKHPRLDEQNPADDSSEGSLGTAVGLVRIAFGRRMGPAERSTGHQRAYVLGSSLGGRLACHSCGLRRRSLVREVRRRKSSPLERLRGGDAH